MLNAAWRSAARLVYGSWGSVFLIKAESGPIYEAPGGAA
jgi:hypothetical protein